ncbi:MAG: hypothetical protein ACM3SS_11365 [Rhodospirillaceae bacterium]
MARDRNRNDERSRIAHLAARLMAEDGIEDYATAKRKAARQAGIPDTRQLPTNEEVDEALRLHQALYQADEHPERLRALREHAMEAMKLFERFNPYLTGSVLAGNAGKYADINLQLYTDSAKAVELFLIDRRIDYRSGQQRLYIGGTPRTVPMFTVEDRGTEVQLVVLDTHDMRVAVKTSPEGKPMERAKLNAVEALLDI